MELKRKILLGIDPSFINFGACVYDPKLNTMILKTGTMPFMVKWIQSQCKLNEVVAVVENPDLDKAVFKSWGMVNAKIKEYTNHQIWLQTKRGTPPKITTIQDVQSAFLISTRLAQNVGENKAAAKQIILMLKDANVPVYEVAPSKRDKAFTKKAGKTVRRDVRLLKMPTKTTQKQFNELTGYVGRSSEHARDAATLVFGKTAVWANMMAETEAKTKKRQPSKPDTTNGNSYLVKRKTKVKSSFESSPKPF